MRIAACAYATDTSSNAIRPLVHLSDACAREGRRRSAKQQTTSNVLQAEQGLLSGHPAMAPYVTTQMFRWMLERLPIREIIVQQALWPGAVLMGTPLVGLRRTDGLRHRDDQVINNSCTACTCARFCPPASAQPRAVVNTRTALRRHYMRLLTGLCQCRSWTLGGDSSCAVGSGSRLSGTRALLSRRLR